MSQTNSTRHQKACGIYVSISSPAYTHRFHPRSIAVSQRCKIIYLKNDSPKDSTCCCPLLISKHNSKDRQSIYLHKWSDLSWWCRYMYLPRLPPWWYLQHPLSSWSVFVSASAFRDLPCRLHVWLHISSKQGLRRLWDMAPFFLCLPAGSIPLCVAKLTGRGLGEAPWPEFSHNKRAYTQHLSPTNPPKSCNHRLGLWPGSFCFWPKFTRSGYQSRAHYISGSNPHAHLFYRYRHAQIFDWQIQRRYFNL